MTKTKTGRSNEEWMQLGFDVSAVFTPAAPVNEDELFAGRLEQLNRVIDAINQVGQHVIIFGERGVGKTSLANILHSRIKTVGGATPIAPKVNCNTLESYGEIWREVFSQLPLVQTKETAGFGDDVQEVPVNALSADDPKAIVPNVVCNALSVAVRADSSSLRISAGTTG